MAQATKEIYFVRHGDVGFQGRYIGSSDPQLTPLGVKQLDQLSSFLEKKAIEVVFCSPLRRCRESLEMLGLFVPVILCDELREVDFGAWEGKNYDEILAEDATTLGKWASPGGDFCFPGGESLRSFYQRLTGFWEMLRLCEEQRLLLVTHGGVIRHLLCLALGLPWEKYLSFDIALGSCATLKLYSQGGVLTGLNLQGNTRWRR